MVDPTWTHQEKRMLKYKLENDLMAFTRYFIKKRTGDKCLPSKHQPVITKTLQKVYDGEIKRLIINMPPGFGKTDIAVICFIAWCLAKDYTCKFLHLAYGDELALTNSSEVRSLVESDEYQELWPMSFKRDRNSKKTWHVDAPGGGGVDARALRGQVMGFRAGRMKPGSFSGAMILDDLLNSKDGSKSELNRSEVNRLYSETAQSRLALDTETPIVLIMQRLHDDDLSGYLLRGGSGEVWHHLMLCAEMDSAAPYPKKYTHGVPIEHDIPDGPLWPVKLRAERIEQLKSKQGYTWHAQYQQDPQPVGDVVFNPKWWRWYKNDPIPSFEWMAIYADTAQKTKEQHDYSVFQLWGMLQGNIYLVDQIRGKWEAPDLKRMAIAFINKWHHPSATYNRIKFMKVEDKVSGTGLIQSIKNEVGIAVLPIKPNSDKLTRAMDAAPFIEAGRVWIPANTDWVLEYLQEFNSFTKDDSHRHDDQIDPTMYAIQDMLQKVGRFGIMDI